MSVTEIVRGSELLYLTLGGYLAVDKNVKRNYRASGTALASVKPLCLGVLVIFPDDQSNFHRRIWIKVDKFKADILRV